MACIETAGVTVLISGIFVAAFSGISVGPKLPFTKNALKWHVLPEISHKVLVGKGKFVDEGRNSGGEVQVVIVVGGSGGDKEG